MKPLMHQQLSQIYGGAFSREVDYDYEKKVFNVVEINNGVRKEYVIGPEHRDFAMHMERITQFDNLIKDL